MDTFTKTILDTIDDIIVLIDKDMNIVKVNSTGLNLLDYHDRELERKPVSSIISTECAAHLCLQEKNKHEHAVPVPAILHTKDGTDIPVSLTISVVYGLRGTCHGAVLKLRKLKDGNDQMLQRSEQEYRQLVEKAGLAIVIDNKDGELTFCNKSCLDLYGYTADEMKHQTLQTLVHPDDLQRVLQYHKDRFTNNHIRY